MTKRLRRISEYPYLRDDALSFAIRTKGVDYKDKFFTYKWSKFKDKIYGDGFDITQFDEFDWADEVYRKSYPHPFIVKIKLKKLKRTDNMTDEQIEKEYKKYKKHYKDYNLKDPAFGSYYNAVITNSNSSNSNLNTINKRLQNTSLKNFNTTVSRIKNNLPSNISRTDVNKIVRKMRPFMFNKIFNKVKISPPKNRAGIMNSMKTRGLISTSDIIEMKRRLNKAKAEANRKKGSNYISKIVNARNKFWNTDKQIKEYIKKHPIMYKHKDKYKTLLKKSYNFTTNYHNAIESYSYYYLSDELKREFNDKLGKNFMETYSRK